LSIAHAPPIAAQQSSSATTQTAEQRECEKSVENLNRVSGELAKCQTAAAGDRALAKSAQAEQKAERMKRVSEEVARQKAEEDLEKERARMPRWKIGGFGLVLGLALGFFAGRRQGGEQ